MSLWHASGFSEAIPRESTEVGDGAEKRTNNCDILLKHSARLSFRSSKRHSQVAEKGGRAMRIEKQVRFNEWLLGSTILCQSCGCLWLVPAAQQAETYVCRQCGSTVTSKPRSKTDEPPKREE